MCNDLVFHQLIIAELLILINWLSLFMVNRIKIQMKQGPTPQVATIYAVFDPKGNDAKTLCKP